MTRPDVTAAHRWEATVLDRYIADPEAVVPGTRMILPPPLRDERERTDLIAYLARDRFKP